MPHFEPDDYWPGSCHTLNLMIVVCFSSGTLQLHRTQNSSCAIVGRRTKWHNQKKVRTKMAQAKTAQVKMAQVKMAQMASKKKKKNGTFVTSIKMAKWHRGQNWHEHIAILTNIILFLISSLIILFLHLKAEIRNMKYSF